MCDWKHRDSFESYTNVDASSYEDSHLQIIMASFPRKHEYQHDCQKLECYKNFRFYQKWLWSVEFQNFRNLEKKVIVILVTKTWPFETSLLSRVLSCGWIRNTLNRWDKCLFRIFVFVKKSYIQFRDKITGKISAMQIVGWEVMY
jgi:hypothetical protein